MEITLELKQAIRTAMLKARGNFGGTDDQYSKSLGINNSVYSRIKSGEIEGMLSDGKWINIGSKFQVNVNSEDWTYVETEVYNMLADNFQFCQRTQTSMMLGDDCGIGKTENAKIIISKMKNGFYIDCSQSKTKIQFMKQIAKALGCDITGRYYDILDNVKYYINLLYKPFFCLDEFGDLEYNAYLEIKALMNATPNAIYYAMGADGLVNKMDRGISNRKVGFAELFSRFSDDYVKITPNGKDDRQAFYLKLFRDMARPNLVNKANADKVAKQCLAKLNKNAKIKSGRYLKTLVKIENDYENNISQTGPL